MNKKLIRPGTAQPSPDVIGDMLGLREPSLPPTRLTLGDLDVISGFNPRTAALSPTEQAALFIPEALDDLVRSMQEVLADGQPRGVLQPLLVRPTNAGRYAVIAGERRFHAARLAGLQDVPVIIRNMTEREALAAAIIENAQRLKVDQVSEALAGFRLLALLTGLTEDEVVKHLNAVRQGDEEDRFDLERILKTTFGTGISTWSQQRSKVLQLLPEERRAIQSARLPAKTVFPLLRLRNDHPARLRLLSELLAREEPPSSQEAVALVQRELQPASAKPDRSVQFRRLVPHLKKLTGDKAREADRLLQALHALLD